jgi:SAM-dependent methyltransferase
MAAGAGIAGADRAAGDCGVGFNPPRTRAQFFVDDLKGGVVQGMAQAGARGSGAYTAAQFARDRDLFEQSHGSAEVIVPLLLEWFPCRSVLDLGCGPGIWLSVFRRHGVDDVLGIDGPAAERILRIPRDRFQIADLRRLGAPERCFEMACCLEVAEHLPPEKGPQIVDYLTAAAPVVVFSAAVPGQRGPGHINERWQDYWRELFRSRGLLPFDIVRRAVWGDRRVSWWYQQNLIVYARSRPASVAPIAGSLNVVHPQLFARSMTETDALRALTGALLRRFRPRPLEPNITREMVDVP